MLRLMGWLLLLALLVPGCSKHATAPELLSVTITPANGATGVPTNASVVLGFNEAVNTTTVQQSFHLISPDPTYAGDMTSMMSDPDVMNHMIRTHSMSGQYQWNGDRRCTFTPTTPMQPGSQYMIYLDMTEMMGSGSMMGSGPMMDGHQANMTQHFTTMRASP